jgi:hypothetical protein
VGLAREVALVVVGGALIAAALWLTRAVDARGDEPQPMPRASSEIAPGLGPVRYQLTATLDPHEHRIAGSGVIHWRNASRTPQREIWLHAYLNAFKNERTVFMRSPAGSGFRGGGQPDRWGYLTIERLFAREHGRDLWPGAARTSPGDEEDETDIRVPLAQAVEPGEQLTLEVSFNAQLPSVVLRTGFAGSFHLAGQWFPKLARLEEDGSWSHFAFHRLSEFYADFADYDVTIDVPAAYLVGATGVPTGEPTRADGRARHSFRAERVIDFAFTAWDGFDELRRMAGAVELVALFPREDRRAAELELDAVQFGLAHFGERYGSYPYRRLTIVRPPRTAREAGGMEYPMLITTGGGMQGRFLGMRSLELLATHELAHQWFYGLLASNEHRYPLLDEGLASYAEIEAMEARLPDASGAEAFGLAIGMPAGARMVAARVARAGAIARTAAEFGSGSAYSGLVYARTATLLLTLERVYGKDKLSAALARYTREQRFRHPEPDALVSAIAAEVGEDAALQLRSALAGGWVDNAVVRFSSWPTRRPSGIFGVSSAPSQPASSEVPWRGFVAVRHAGTLSFPVDVEVWTGDGARSRMRWDGRGDEVVLDWQGDHAITAVVVDPDGRVLLDDDLSNNAKRAAPARTAPRVLAVGAWLAQAAMGVVLP